jgi:hypothetical protein
MACKNYLQGQAQWCTSIIPAIWEAEVGGLKYGARSRQKVRSYLKNSKEEEEEEEERREGGGEGEGEERKRTRLASARVQGPGFIKIFLKIKDTLNNFKDSAYNSKKKKNLGTNLTEAV